MSIHEDEFTVNQGVFVLQAKEAYQARSQEAEKLRKDCSSSKDIPTLEKVSLTAKLILNGRHCFSLVFSINNLIRAYEIVFYSFVGGKES